jgi:hypothetical protein
MGLDTREDAWVQAKVHDPNDGPASEPTTEEDLEEAGPDEEEDDELGVDEDDDSDLEDEYEEGQLGEHDDLDDTEGPKD